MPEFKLLRNGGRTARARNKSKSCLGKNLIDFIAVVDFFAENIQAEIKPELVACYNVMLQQIEIGRG